MLEHEITVDDLKRGYIYEDESYKCIFCEQVFADGEIYRHDQRLLDARRAVSIHIRDSHGSAFAALAQQDKRITGLSDINNRLMSMMYNGVSDKDIAAAAGTAAATVRSQRFALRVKARQAAVFLAMYQLLSEQPNNKEEPRIHSGATMVDERYNATQEDTRKAIDAFFSSTDPLVLKMMPPKEKKKIILLRVIAGQFDRSRRYSEKEVNEILRPIYYDVELVRRYLIQYGFLDRTRDGREYWVKD